MHYSNLGKRLAWVGRLTEAEEAYRAEVKFMPGDPQAHVSAHPYRSNMLNTWFFLAMAHHRLGHADLARRWLEKAIQGTEEALKSPAESQGKPLRLRSTGVLRFSILFGEVVFLQRNLSIGPVGRQRIDVRLERPPARKPELLGQFELRVGQFGVRVRLPKRVANRTPRLRLVAATSSPWPDKAGWLHERVAPVLYCGRLSCRVMACCYNSRQP